VVVSGRRHRDGLSDWIHTVLEAEGVNARKGVANPNPKRLA
jgi:hypothetical protein